MGTARNKITAQSQFEYEIYENSVPFLNKQDQKFEFLMNLKNERLFICGRVAVLAISFIQVIAKIYVQHQTCMDATFKCQKNAFRMTATIRFVKKMVWMGLLNGYLGTALPLNVYAYGVWYGASQWYEIPLPCDTVWLQKCIETGWRGRVFSNNSFCA